MSHTPRAAPGDLLDLIASVLEDLTTGTLDGPLPELEAAATERERELVARMRLLVVSRRRAAAKLAHMASAIASEVGELHSRATVVASANAGVEAATSECQVVSKELGDSARRISHQANELHALSEAAAEATSDVAESGQQVTRESQVLSSAIADVATSATSIAASLRDVDRSVGSLASEIAKTSNAVGSINASINQIDVSASETSTLSEEMALAAARGRDVVQKTAVAVESITSAIYGVQLALERLEQRSDEVTEITKIIQAIAVQAKLLALNASIQASHAGEAGRGFAVVAREIKQLSDSTTVSTRQIESVVRAIRSEVAQAVTEARGSSERAHEGLSLAKAARDALETIAGEVELIRSRVLQISGATSSQASETAVLKRAMGRVSELADRLRSTSGDRHGASQKVVGRAREIGGLAERVRLAMSEQETASLGIVKLIEGLNNIARVLEVAAENQSVSMEDLARAVARIETAGQENSASVAVMSYATGLLERQVNVLRDEASDITLPAPNRGGRLRIPVAITRDLASLDPIRGYAEAHVTLLDGIFERLVCSEEGGRIAPALARSWNVSGDGKRYTFRLRPGVLFHHGRELTSDDVRFSFDRAIRQSVSGAYIFTSVVGAREAREGASQAVAGIATPDAYTVEIELVEPIAFFLEMLSLVDAAITPRDVVERDPELFARQPIGTGPFRFVEMTDSGVRVERFLEYRDPNLPFVDEVDYVFDVRGEDAVDGVLRGDYAYTRYVPRARLRELLADVEHRSQLQWITLPQCLYLLMNSSPDALPDPRVRRAIAHAIDRQAVVARYNTAPVAIAAEGLVPPTCPGFNPALRGPEFDSAKARALLDEAGYDFRRPLRVFFSEGMWALGSDAGSVVVENLEAVGFTIEAVFSKHLNSIRAQGAFDLLEASWVGDYLDPDTFTFGPFHSQFGSFGGGGRVSEELDDLFQRARSSTDIGGRAGLYARIHEVFQQVCPALVVLHRRDFVVQNERVEGLQLIPQLPAVRVRDIWIAGPLDGGEPTSADAPHTR
jgi:oligopeptide transport system substrate-binding protein